MEERLAIDFTQGLSPERRNDILTHIEEEAKRIFEKMPLLPVHDITHVERVVRNTELICEGEGVDSFLPTIAAWLHDIGRLEELQASEKGEVVNHAQASAGRTSEILAPFRSDLREEKIEAIQKAVARHSSPNAEDDSLLAIILKDADRLDGMGAIGLPRVFAFYPEKPIYTSGDPFGERETSEAYLRYSGQSTQIRALFRNMEWFADPRFGLRTRMAIELGTPRIQLMIDFLCQLADELGVTREQVDELPVVQMTRKRIEEFEDGEKK